MGIALRHFGQVITIGTTVLITACDGGGGSDNTSESNNNSGTASFIVTAVAGAGGSINLGAITVNEGDTASFTITPDSGFSISGVSGCNGTLLGNSYRTGNITADCTVNATFAQDNTNSGDVVLSLRPVSSEIDFDNNGVMDAIESFTYDVNGRQTQYIYTYMGDGITDFIPY